MQVRYDQLASFVQDIESSYDVLRFQVDSWSVWALFRMQAGVYCLGGVAKPRKKVLGLRPALSTLFHDLPTLLTPSRSRIVVLSLNSARTEQTPNGYKDIFFDDILKDRSDFIKIEDIENPIFLRQSQRAAVPSHASLLGFRIAASLACRAKRVPQQVTLAAQAIGKVLRGPLGLSSYTDAAVARRIERFYWEKRVYRLFLRRLSPEVLINIGAHFFEFFAAARELGLTPIEFQHGFVDRHTHLGYAWGPYARQYKKNLPIACKLFLYGEHWRRELHSDGFWEEELTVVGSPRVDAFRTRRSLKTDRTANPLFLWSSDGIEQEAGIRFVHGALAAVDPKLKFVLVIKLHPHAEDSKQPYLDAFGRDSRVRILLGNESPSTFELLADASVHFSGSSTCHFEAIALGTPTIILPIRSYEKVINLVQHGHAYFAETPLALADYFREWRELTVKDGAGEHYFKSGAVQNVLQALNLKTEFTIQNSH